MNAPSLDQMAQQVQKLSSLPAKKRQVHLLCPQLIALLRRAK